MRILSRIVIGVFLAFVGIRTFFGGGSLPDYTDITRFTFPDIAFNRYTFQQGFIPLWNPYIGCGAPQLPYWHSSCLYPPFWILNLTKMIPWFIYVTATHRVFVFFGSFLWLRRRVGIPLLAFLGALAFTYCGHITRCGTNLPFLATAVWIPWIFWAADRALEKKSFGSWFLLGLLVSLQALAGYPFFLFFTVFFLVIWFEFQRPTPESQRSFWVTMVVAALFTSLQWLPFLGLMTYAFHDRWLDYPYFTKPLEYLTLLRPDILGQVGTEAYKGSFANANFNLYVGLVPLIAWGVGGWKLVAQKAPGRFWVLAGFIWLLWLAGGHFPPWRIVPERILEFLEPSKAVGLFAFSAITATAYVLKPLFRNDRKYFLWVLGLAVFWAMDCYSVPLLLMNSMPDPFVNKDILINAEKLHSLVDGDRMVSLHTSLETTFSGPNALEQSLNSSVELCLPNSNSVWRLRSPDKYLYLQVSGSEDLNRYLNRGFPYDGDLLDIAGVRLFFITQPLRASKYRIESRLKGDYLILNSQASPDMRWVGGQTILPDRPSILNRLAGVKSGWREKIYLDQSPGASPTNLAPLNHSRGFQATKGYQRENGSRASLADDFSKSGYVVFNETFAPGWHAWVDGQPLPILRAYGLFMAVPVAAGPHQVDFRYEPTTFRLGLFTSLITLVFSSVWLLRSYFLKPKSYRSVN